MPWGSALDLIGESAQQLLIVCSRLWFNRESILGLLDLGLTDHGPRHQNFNHPLRVLGEMARQLDPDRGPIFETRRTLLSHATSWLKVDVQDPTRWEVFAEVVTYCFAPGVEGTWNDPAATSTFTIANGVESPDHLAGLIEIWADVAALIDATPPSTLPDGTVRHLIEVFEEWLRLAGGHSSGTVSVNQEQRDVAYRGAWVILETLRPLLDARPGLAPRATKALDLAGRWNVQPPSGFRPLALDEDVVLLVGRREPWDSVEEWIEQRDSEIRELARRLLMLGPQAGSARFLNLTTAADASGQEGGGEALAHRIATLADDPAAWIPYAAANRVPALLHHSLREARKRGIEVDGVVVERALADAALRSPTISAILEGTGMDSITELALGRLGPDDWWLLERLFTRSHADPVLRALLIHPIREVRAASSLAFGVGVRDGPSLPVDWTEDWRAAFLEASSKSVHRHLEYRLQEILKGLATEDPDLCGDWFERRIHENEPSWHGPWMRDVEEIARSLPASVRERLARQCAGRPYRTVELLPHLLGHDANLAAQLLNEGVLDPMSALGALSGRRDAGVEVLAPVLLDHGVPATHIARRVCADRSWEGDESRSINADIAWFRDLAERAPALRPVSDAAIAQLATDLDRALQEEHEDRRRGRL